MSKQPINVRLREVTKADLPTLFEIQRQPEANDLAGVNPRDAGTFYAVWDKVLVDPNVIPRAILADEVLVGSINRFKMEDKDAVGYWIDRAHWGKGIISQALALFLDEVKTRPLYATAATANTASTRALQRCGFAITHAEFCEATDRYIARHVTHFKLS